MDLLKRGTAAIGALVIVGNIAFYSSPAFRLWLIDPERNMFLTMGIGSVVLIIWMSSLMGIMVPFMNLELPATREQKKDALHRFYAAVSLGFFVSWICVASIEMAWKSPQSLMTLHLFTAWSFAAAICLVQQIFPLPRFKIVTEAPAS